MEEKKVVVAYTVYRYEDGSVDAKDAEVEGTTPVSSEEAYKDIEEVARLIQNKRIENAAYVGAFNGTVRYYQQVEAQRAAAEAAQAE